MADVPPIPTTVKEDGETSTSEFMGVDPSSYTVLPNAFLRPKISIPGGASFTWPLGVEGFTRSGSSGLGVHKYMGDNAAVVEVMHSEEGRVEMTGLFPGKTSTANMAALLDVLRLGGPVGGKDLYLPGVFRDVQKVVAENWSFSHEEGDWTDSILYTISFILLGTGKKIKVPKITLPHPNPTTKIDKGKPQRTFTVKDGARTLSAIAKLKYGNAKQWTKLYNLNKTLLTKFLKAHNISLHQLPTRPLPIGMKLTF